MGKYRLSSKKCFGGSMLGSRRGCRDSSRRRSTRSGQPPLLCAFFRMCTLLIAFDHFCLCLFARSWPQAVTKKYFDDFKADDVEERPLIMTGFLNFTPDDMPIYCAVGSYEILKKTLDDQLASHNETNAVMELVLFQQAMEHVTRISRIIGLPRGNAMLVGVGGSGKQSLCRLASFICGYEIFQISVTSSYGVNEFKENLLALYVKAGIKTTPVTFMMTDGQIVQERFLVYINDYLSCGFIPDLMTPEDKDNMCNGVRN
eukprot:1191438-Prorocentrum_minimum.AAC.1